MSTTDDLQRQIDALKLRLDNMIPQESATPRSGSWTPAFVGSGTAGVFTYTNQLGQYYQFGQFVFINCRITISAIGTPPVGTMSISGLPFASAARNNAITFGRISQFKYTAAALQLMGLIGGSATSITLAESFTNASVVNVPAANFTNAACDLIFNGFYDLP